MFLVRFMQDMFGSQDIEQDPPIVVGVYTTLQRAQAACWYYGKMPVNFKPSRSYYLGTPVRSVDESELAEGWVGLVNDADGRCDKFLITQVRVDRTY